MPTATKFYWSSTTSSTIGSTAKAPKPAKECKIADNSIVSSGDLIKFVIESGARPRYGAVKDVISGDAGYIKKIVNQEKLLVWLESCNDFYVSPDELVKFVPSPCAEMGISEHYSIARFIRHYRSDYTLQDYDSLYFYFSAIHETKLRKIARCKIHLGMPRMANFMEIHNEDKLTTI